MLIKADDKITCVPSLLSTFKLSPSNSLRLLFTQSDNMGSIQQEIDTGKLLSKLTLEEKVSLLAAVDWWRTPVIKRDGVFVPHIKVCLSRFFKIKMDLLNII